MIGLQRIKERAEMGIRINIKILADQTISDLDREVKKNVLATHEMYKMLAELYISDKELDQDNEHIYEVFNEWAEQFFKITNKEGELKYINNYFTAQLGHDEFIKFSKQTKWPFSKFNKQLRIYCELNNYSLNPRELCTHNNRIIRRFGDKTLLAFYIKSIK
ncbi:hypothetical protein AAGV28_06945 [Flavobacterium sp. FZUC8N2.13]|uniref:Uncharacterized protein n=1 Tax=Flavobacterium zubiriense TaxID=3138075 RepID=A0ABV4TDH3_9FLAO